MRMMWCVGRHSSVSQLTFCSMILSGYKPFFKQGPRPRCSYEIMRVKECVVEHRTVQRVNQLFYISMLLWFCLFYDTARCCIVIDRFFFETMDRLIRRLSSCFACDLNRYDVMRTQPQECTRRTHAVSCGWTNVHDMMHNESYIRTQPTSTSKLLHAPCSSKHWAATASLLLGIFFGFIFFISFLLFVSFCSGFQWYMIYDTS